MLLRDVGQRGRAQTAVVKSYLQDDASLIALADNLRKYFDANQVESATARNLQYRRLFNAPNRQSVRWEFQLPGYTAGDHGGYYRGGGQHRAVRWPLSLSVMERRERSALCAPSPPPLGRSSAVHRRRLDPGRLSAFIAWPLSLPAGQMMVKVLEFPLIWISSTSTPQRGRCYVGIISILSILALLAAGARRNPNQLCVRSLAYQ